jgi:hypothetical protein
MFTELFLSNGLFYTTVIWQWACMSHYSKFILKNCWGTQEPNLSRHVATSPKVAGYIAYEIIFFFNLPHHSSLTVAQSSTRPLTEMSTRNLPGIKGSRSRKADSLTAICDLIALTVSALHKI